MSTPEDREWDAHQDRIVDDQEAHGAYDDEGPAPCRECDGAGVVEVESADEDRDWTACGCQPDPAPVGETRETLIRERDEEARRASQAEDEAAEMDAAWERATERAVIAERRLSSERGRIADYLLTYSVGGDTEDPWQKGHNYAMSEAARMVREQWTDLPTALDTLRATLADGGTPCFPRSVDGHNCTLREGHAGPHLCCDGHDWTADGGTP